MEEQKQRIEDEIYLMHEQENVVLNEREMLRDFETSKGDVEKKG